MNAKDNKSIKVPVGNTREDIKEREAIISDVYRCWYEANPSKAVYNTNLKDYINVRFLSINETIHHASMSYLSTLAVLQLDSILRCSVVYGKPKPPKKGGRQSKGICLYAGDAPRVDRHWPSENDGRSEAYRREDTVLHYCDKGIKKRNRQAGSLERSSPILDVYGLFPY